MILLSIIFKFGLAAFVFFYANLENNEEEFDYS